MAQQLFDEFGRIVRNFYIGIPGVDSKWAAEGKARDAQLYYKTKPSHAEQASPNETPQNEPSQTITQNIDLPKGVEFRIDNNPQPNQPTVKNSPAASVSPEKSFV